VLLWVYSRVLFQKKVLKDPATFFSIFGISLGVAFLVVSMAGFSGFMESLKSSIIDVTGDVSVFRRGGRISDTEDILGRIKKSSPEIVDVMGYTKSEGLVASQGKLRAIMLQGIDLQQKQNETDLLKRMVQSDPDIDGAGAPAYLGKVVANHLNLKVGDSFKLVLPVVSKLKATDLEAKVQTFYLKGTLDFGKYEFNERIVIADIEEVQELANMQGQLNGFRVKLKDSDRAPFVADLIQEELGWDYSVRDWTMTNRSLFKAIKYEKRVLFFVMLIMLIAAFFNVSTTLFLSVLRRYSQISVMRALGLKSRHVLALFCLYGLSLGAVGLFFGLIAGLLFCYGFEFLQVIYPIMPEEVYKMSSFATHITLIDIIWVIIATLVICFISTLAPAIRGSRLSPVEGLKYE
jgi:lipoprotein-releasing system permease protein